MKTKTFLLALLAQLFTLTATAYDAKVGSIYYNLNTTDRTASVTYYDSTLSGGSYSGSITIPTTITYNSVNYRVTAIGGFAFQACRNLTSVTIPSSIKTIEVDAFYSCSALKSVIIPASVNKIGSSAFGNCTQLSSITIPSSVIYIGEGAFENTPWHTQWLEDQADGLCYINSVLYAYKGTMPKNTSITIQNGTTCIGGEGFRDCTNLTSVSIPTSVTRIEGSVFRGCTALKTINIPESVTYIGSYAFSESGLTSFVAKSLTSIGALVYANCASLESIETYTSESGDICKNCSNLTSAVITEGTKTIGTRAFLNCTRLSDVTIPSTVTAIQSTAFQGCSSLSIVRVGMTTPITIDSELFTNRFLATLYVPEGCKAAYEAAEYWQDFQEIIEGSPVDEANLLFYTGTTEAQANSQVTLSIKLANSVAVQGFAFDLALPEGVTVALDEDDFEMVTLSTERTTTKKTNVFDFYTNADGSLHVEASSTRGYTLDGEDGQVVQVLLNIGKDTKDGDYPLTFQNITVTDGEGNEHHPETSTSTLTVLPNHPYDLNGDGQVSIADVTLIVNYILGR